MLEVVSLSKKFKQETVVKDVDMYIEQGETVGLMGPNGAGKSTTISMIASLLEPSGGDILLYNKSILQDPKPLRKILGVVPQEIALYPELSALENLHFFARINKLKGAELKQRVEEVLELIGLSDRRKDLVKTYSGGMKRRLNIGAALLHNPKFIIMDEPTVGIDPQSRNYILEAVRKLNQEKNMSVLYTSHYMEEIEFLCDRVYIMDHGEIIASGTQDEVRGIMSSENTVEVKLEKHSELFVEQLRQHEGISSVTVSDSTLTIIAPKGVNIFTIIYPISESLGIQFLSIEVKTPTLEDVFLHLTGRKLRD